MPNQAYPNYAEPTKSHLRVTDWRAINYGVLVGSCTVELSLMRIINVSIMRHPDGTLWAALPGHPQIDRDGKVRINADTGKRMYTSVIAWRSKEIADQFSRKVIAALRNNPHVELPDEPASVGGGETLALGL
jgi:hypothetical protein